MSGYVLEYFSGRVTAETGKTLLQDLRFSLSAGETLALIGETGSGKTMTALSVMGLLPRNVRMNNGEVKYCGRVLRSEKDFASLLGREIVYIPQNGLEFLNPARKIRKQLFDSLKLTGVKRSEREGRARELLRMAGFDDPEDILGRYPFELSGGMAQRVTIALSACGKVKLILADEPSNGLDEQAKSEFMALLKHLFPDAAMLLITHDMTLAELCDRCLVICGGRCMESGDSKAVLQSPVQPYTKALIGALVRNGLRETPVLRTEKGVCPFYSRCSEAAEQCRAEMPRHSSGGREWWCANAASM